MSSVLHIFLNILLGLGAIFSCVVSGSWLIGILLVLISKWRMFAVRPRFWLLNLKSNLVDILISLSLVLLSYFSGTTLLPVHYFLAGFYVLYLVVIKPLSKETGAFIQSLLAVLLGTTAAVLISASLNSAVLVILEFIIGYAASRHILIQNPEVEDFSFVVLICGLIFSEVSWLAHSWLIVYSFGTTGLILPQLSVVLTIISFVFHKIYAEFRKRDGEIKSADIILPLLFGVITIAVIIIGFSEPFFNV